MQQPVITIRDATVEDLPRIFAIYNEEVEHGIATFDVEPRRVGRDDDWQTGRAPYHPVVVAVDANGRVAGWA
jgi:phosphinothricin acetyltransferase